MLLQPLDLRVEGVDVVEQPEVLVLRLHEAVDELLDVPDAGRLLNLLKRLAVRLHPRLRLFGVSLGLTLRPLTRHVPLLLLPLFLVSLRREPRLLRGALRFGLVLHERAHLLIVLDELGELAPLLLKRELLLVRLLLELRHLAHGLVPGLVRLIGPFDDLAHPVLLLREFVLELLVDVVEQHPLLAQVVDRAPQLPVVRQRVVVLSERLIEPVLEHLETALDVRVLLLRGVDASHLASLLDDLSADAFDAGLDILRPAFLHLGASRELVGLGLEPEYLTRGSTRCVGVDAFERTGVIVEAHFGSADGVGAGRAVSHFRRFWLDAGNLFGRDENTTGRGRCPGRTGRRAARA